jgi:hypothetical protein
LYTHRVPQDNAHAGGGGAEERMGRRKRDQCAAERPPPAPLRSTQERSTHVLLPTQHSHVSASSARSPHPLYPPHALCSLQSGGLHTLSHALETPYALRPISNSLILVPYLLHPRPTSYSLRSSPGTAYLVTSTRGPLLLKHYYSRTGRHTLTTAPTAFHTHLPLLRTSSTDPKLHPAN